ARWSERGCRVSWKGVRPQVRLCPTCVTRGSPREPHVHLPLDVAPPGRAAQLPHQVLEAAGVAFRVFEPGEEVERAAEVAAMVEAARHRGQVAQADRDVSGLLLQDAPALVLRQVPPLLGLAHKDQRRARAVRPPQGRPPYEHDWKGVHDLKSREAALRYKVSDPA